MKRLTCGLILLIPSLAFGQRISFEVATIKPAEPITPASIASGKLNVGVSVTGSGVSLGYLSVAEMIPIAYKVDKMPTEN
jgi:uncharacterized protein (TIGR03435 family)